MRAARELLDLDPWPHDNPVYKVELEVPFLSAGGAVVGFADACYVYSNGSCLWIEIKTDDTQTGALIRQIKQYRVLAANAARKSYMLYVRKKHNDILTHEIHAAAVEHAETIAIEHGHLWAALVPHASERTVAMLRNEGIIVVGP